MRTRSRKPSPRQNKRLFRLVHHYDRLGLVSPSLRTESGHRLYTEADVLRLQQVISLRALAFSLAEIKGFLDRSASALQAMSKWEPPEEEISRSARVVFTLTPDGSVESMHLESSSGSPEFDQRCLAAVKKSSFQFGRLADGSEEPLDIVFSFEHTIANSKSAAEPEPLNMSAGQIS